MVFRVDAGVEVQRCRLEISLPPLLPLFLFPRRMPLPSPSDQLALYTGTLTALTSSTSSGDLVGLCVGSSFLQLKPKQAKVLLAGETQRALLALNEEG